MNAALNGSLSLPKDPHLDIGRSNAIRRRYASKTGGIYCNLKASMQIKDRQLTEAQPESDCLLAVKRAHYHVNCVNVLTFVKPSSERMVWPGQEIDIVDYEEEELFPCRRGLELNLAMWINSNCKTLLAYQISVGEAYRGSLRVHVRIEGSLGYVENTR